MRKIALKADTNMVDIQFPKQLKELKSELVSSIDYIKHELQTKVATKDDIKEIAADKANSIELHDLANVVSNKITSHEVNLMLNQQVAPLVTAISAMEKIVHIQNEEVIYQTNHLQNKGLQSLRNSQENNIFSNNNSGLTVDKVYNMIQEYIHQHHLGDVTPVRVDAALAQHTEVILKEMNSLLETNRLELQVENKDMFYSIYKTEIKEKLNQLAKEAEESR